MLPSTKDIKVNLVRGLLLTIAILPLAEQCQAAKYIFTLPNSQIIGTRPTLPTCSTGVWASAPYSNYWLSNQCYNAFGPYGSIQKSCYFSDGYLFFAYFNGSTSTTLGAVYTYQGPPTECP